MTDINQQEIAPDGKPFQRIKLVNQNGMTVEFSDWGATWLCCKVPVLKLEENQQELREVLLGCATLKQHSEQGAYLGATVGRFANRIANARFSLNGKDYVLDANQLNANGQATHQLHGGSSAFDKRRWQILQQMQDSVQFGLESADHDQGFPGAVSAKVRYSLCADNALVIEFEAVADQDTPLNLTNHAYFSLDGESAHQNVLRHHLKIAADYYLPVNSEGIPKEPLKSVDGSGFDFRHGKTLVKDFLSDPDQKLVAGYDHSFLLNKTELNYPSLNSEPQVELSSSSQDLTLKIFTDQPAIQIYSGNFLGGTPNRSGSIYADHAGVALETQCLPDTPNHPEWFQHGGISKAGEVYRKTTVFLFE